MVLSVDIDWVQNSFQYKELFKFLIPKFAECEQIIFIETHHQIIKYLHKSENSIVNIDHHHDIGYTDVDGQISINPIMMGNWVGSLTFHSRLKEYTWIHNEDSDLTPHSSLFLQKIDKFNFNPNLNYISTLNFNKIIICNSFDHIKNSFKIMGLGRIYEILKILATSLYNKKTIIDNTPNPFKNILIK
jgi:hypothetical protein